MSLQEIDLRPNVELHVHHYTDNADEWMKHLVKTFVKNGLGHKLIDYNDEISTFDELEKILNDKKLEETRRKAREKARAKREAVKKELENEARRVAEVRAQRIANGETIE